MNLNSLVAFGLLLFVSCTFLSWNTNFGPLHETIICSKVYLLLYKWSRVLRAVALSLYFYFYKVLFGPLHEFCIVFVSQDAIFAGVAKIILYKWFVHKLTPGRMNPIFSHNH